MRSIQVNTWLLLAATALGLSACGSSGGSNNMVATQSHNTPTPTSPTNPTAANFVNQGGTNYLVSVNTSNLNSAEAKHSLTFDANSFYKITLNGISIDLLPTAPNNMANVTSGTSRWGLYSGNLSAGASHTPAGISNILVSRSSENVVVGVIGAKSNGNTSGHIHNFAFVNGNATDIAQIPKQGIATYDVNVAGHVRHTDNQGHTSVSQSTNLLQDNSPARLSVNFGAKTLTGKFDVKDTYGADVDIKANIMGNRFESAAGSTTAVKGGFYGNNATEIGGVFQTEKTIGVFIGTKK
ncbi:transferrin-binding protein-like solute binding protein [Kingella kingae]|uniref:transferrin-binding protein-like solute binding protein n=1 Tax=Kingella kingae TaxID=504 RepID=UPI0002585574|nr:transferrin-binding protein-like solute binding protein [Kingella kingae]EIC13317.1 transferrin-binding protein 2 [Kingella kingae PYKK081]MDK4542141.1 transferrin-binding protein-like solute binding protein [Kingella kingae]MDK4562172.1 transferrin-binding protein-like solute binding protein [Kingella kingae]MDK4568405.1 transferrin-binding protein-like solute binding protein [Kingella kingae]MDK4570368.1 transferrin-binding protein-like solute binding protein [Kingella kingae]